MAVTCGANSHTLSVIAWAALAPGLSSRNDWQDWARGMKQPTTETPIKPELPQIPAMHRRRLSLLGKAALWCCYQVMSDFDVPHASIFCSQHGEVEHTVKLLKELAKDEPLSPTAFSLSVHNAIAGIHSISRNITGNITALAAGPDGHFASLLEAYALLDQSPELERILCVIYDAPLPEIYDTDAQSPEFPVATAMLLGRAPDPDAEFELSVSLQPPGSDTPPSSNTEQMLLQFIRFLASSEQPSIATRADIRTWHCQKSD